jgi:hypothetical protein
MAIPHIVPPGQWDTILGEDDAEQPKGSGIENVHEGFFEKRIGRIGGPLPPDKQKAQPMTDPTVAIQQIAAIHRAIQIARK